MDKLELVEKVPLTSHEKEVYRTLRTNVEFTGIENRVLAITSCAPDEGKTTVAFNLANAFAENGKKALYIDASHFFAITAASITLPKGGVSIIT